MTALTRYAISISAAAVLFAGCGGSQTPIGAGAAIPQSRMRHASSSYTVLYRFGRYPDGEEPVGGLTDVGGVLYGTASNGGKRGCHQRGGCGTFFSITPKGAEKLLYTFEPWEQGVHPQSRLIDVKGTLYGTTYQGGPSAKGTVYSISTTGSESVLYNFQGRLDGAYPRAGVIYVNGMFYGTNTYGGGDDRDEGTAYSVSPSGVHTVLHSFKGRLDGHKPVGGLVNVNGTLYGTTISGGGTGCECGTVYSLTTSGKETLLYRFVGGSDGESPESGLLNVNGTLYGTTYGGGGTGCGSTGCGTVYSVTTTGKERVIYRFAGSSDGANPVAGVINVNGTLYGTTVSDGSTPCYCGTVYSISATGAESTLYAFTGGTDGMRPQALTAVKGTLYGVTAEGGDPAKAQYCCGTIFALKP